MTKLYPPIIEGTIPAFYGDSITIPYSMNRMVNKNEIAGFSLKIKTVQSNLFLGTIIETLDYDDKEVKFQINNEWKEKLNIGQYYKVQLAYGKKKSQNSNDLIIGDYSTVGIIKYTTAPTVEIEELKDNNINHVYNYTGHYSQENGDHSEKVYSYKFIIYDDEEKTNIIASSGEQLHKYEDDDSNYESFDKFKFAKEILNNETYYIQYKVTTTNKAVFESQLYEITAADLVRVDPGFSLLAEMNNENGYVNLSLKGNKLASGNFILSRRREDEPGNWVELVHFGLSEEDPSLWSWKDFVVEQGVNYYYSIQQYNTEKIYSTRISNKVYDYEMDEWINGPVRVDFEHAYLFDGEKQLKIKYNPKISSFKDTLLESKVDTIGGKYPFIFRNGHTSYKEFPISGLISYYMDEENLFMDEDNYSFKENLFRKKTATVEESFKEKNLSLDEEKIFLERQFKLAVLDWLNNGELKIFKSPTEGNYIVRLMNSTLSPNDTLGRMLHTFSSTAYEMYEYNTDNLNDLEFIGFDLGSMKSSIEKEIHEDLSDWYNDGTKDWTENLLINNRITKNFKFENLTEGDRILITYNGSGESKNIYIGKEKFYQAIDIPAIKSIKLHKNNKKTGTLTYTYTKNINTIFNTYKEINNKDIIAKQVFGNDFKNIDIIKGIEDIKTKVSYIYYLHIKKRPVLEVTVDEDAFDENNIIKSGKKIYHNGKEIVNGNSYSLYKIIGYSDNKINGAYIDGRDISKISFFDEEYSVKALLNKDIDENKNLEAQLIALSDIKLYNKNIVEFENIEPKNLYIGTGLVAELGYVASDITYIYDDIDDSDYMEAIQDYIDLKGNYNNFINGKEQTEEKIKTEYNKLLENIENKLDIFREEYELDE